MTRSKKGHSFSCTGFDPLSRNQLTPWIAFAPFSGLPLWLSTSPQCAQKWKLKATQCLLLCATHWCIGIMHDVGGRCSCPFEAQCRVAYTHTAPDRELNFISSQWMHERLLNMEYISRLVYWHIYYADAFALCACINKAAPADVNISPGDWRMYVQIHKPPNPLYPPACLRCTDTYKYIITHPGIQLLQCQRAQRPQPVRVIRK